MATTPLTTPYPFDPTGLAVTNKILGEQHVITAVNYKDYHLVVPRYAPFFAQGLVLRHVDLTNESRDLVEGVDYFLGHQFHSASRACARPIYGSINFFNKTLSGVIVIDQYQTIGGDWTLDLSEITAILADYVHNPRLTSWEAVVDIPVYFPSIDHDWQLFDAVGMSDVVASIIGIENALRTTGTGAIDTHLTRVDNPHEVSAAQVGLGLVPNYPAATNTEALTVVVDRLMTPASTRAAIDAFAATPLAEHINAVNPHGTTAAQVGAYTKAEVESLIAAALNTGAAATDTVRFNGMTSAEFKAWVLEGTAANSILFNGLTYAQAYEDMRANIPIGNVAGAVSEVAFTDAMDLKLNRNEAANDTVRFNNLDHNAFKAWVLEGKAYDSDRFAGMDLSTMTEYIVTTASGGGSTTARQYSYAAYDTPPTGGQTRLWTKLGIYRYNPAEAEPGEMVLSVSGGGSTQHVENATYLVTGQYRVGSLSFALNVTRLLGFSNYGVDFGVTSEEITEDTDTVTIYTLWMKTTSNPRGISITRLLANAGSLPASDTQVAVEPTGITYVSEIKALGVTPAIVSGTVTAGDEITIAYDTVPTPLGLVVNLNTPFMVQVEDPTTPNKWFSALAVLDFYCQGGYLTIENVTATDYNYRVVFSV